MKLNLNPKFRYVWIDFETTGLDTRKDSPIQVGIVEINANGEIIDYFESLIRPDKDITELKNIVSFITKIKTAELVFAPSVSEIAQQIQHFFSDNTIIIGHNIDFDMAFLQRIMPDVKYHNKLDTFALSQALVPYPPSFALEILVNYLEKYPQFVEWKNKFWILKGQDFGENDLDWAGEKFHDAFYDTKCCLVLFCYFMEFVNELSGEFEVVESFLERSDAVIAEILWK